MLRNPIYHRLKEKAHSAAEKIGRPSFYRKYGRELKRSSAAFSKSGIIDICRSRIDESKLHPAHGAEHLEKVAIEAGAVLRIEHEETGRPGGDIEGLMLCAQIAGLLHDVKRLEKDHTVSGSIEAGRILRGLDLSSSLKKYVTAAIRNHEAFKEVLASKNEQAKLISDSLYDADKFRWGPDNFTVTLWRILESTDMPAETLYCSFREKMEWITRIKETFRTETGKKYGPEFIDFGIRIGDEIYKEMTLIMGNRKKCF